VLFCSTAAIKGFLLFSDLHCQLKTLKTCFEVLRAVHALALKEDRIIVFLGDFFNSVYCKAAISVELLNKLVAYFSSEWKVQSYFLVGNHDMPLLTNIDNGLRVFEKVNKAITVVEVPQVLQGALFIPYLHDQKDIARAIQEHGKRAKIILAHAEFKGAMLNSSTRSSHGLNSADMPLPVVSGHLHMPQDGAVVYCGSPYQCSLGEAEQSKRFLRYSPSWERQSDQLAVFGTRYYKIKSSQNLKRRFHEISQILKPQDVVVLDGIDAARIPEDVVSTWEGVVVRRRSKRLKRTVYHASSKSPTEQFRTYMKEHNPKLLHQGLAMITHCAAQQKDPIKLEFESLEMVHFGPFKNQLKIEFKKGLTLLTASRDLKNSHLSSNGAGKSLLVCGALLWVLTGETDPRPTMQSSVSGASKAVVHHGCDFASVTLSGTRNGVAFVVSRRMSSVEKVKHRLTLNIGGDDRTHSVLKQTQLSVNSNLFNLTASPVKSPARSLRHFLLRTVMWNQHSVPRFADASAKDTKMELGWMIDASCWQKLSEDCKGNAAHLRGKIQALKLDIEKQSITIAHLEQNLHYEESSSSTWESNRTESLRDACRLFDAVLIKIDACATKQPRLQSSNATALAAVLAEKRYLRRVQCVEIKEETLPSLQELESAHSNMKVKMAKMQRLLASALERRARAMERRSVSTRKLQNFRSRRGDFCDQCQQRVPSEHRVRMVHKLEQEQSEHDVRFKEFSAEHISLQKKHRRQTSFLCENEKLQRLCNRQLTARAGRAEYAKANARIDEIDAMLPEMQVLAAVENDANIVFENEHRRRAALRAEQIYLERELARFRAMKNPHSTRSTKMKHSLSALAQSLQISRDALQRNEAKFSSASKLAHHFGKDGIQPVLTQAVLQRVESLCASYFRSLHSTQKALTLDCQKYCKSIQEAEWCTPVNLLSGGELRRLQLASFLAFSQITMEKTNVCMDIRIFDEPCAPLDAAGHGAFLRQLKTLYPAHKTILISHANAPENMADHHLKIRSVGLYRSSVVV